MAQGNDRSGAAQYVAVDGHRIRLTNLDKIVYPETGTTKGEVIEYYARVAEWLLPHARNRPATRKRWVDGTGTDDEPGSAFFQKDLDDSTPYWVSRRTIQHSDHDNSYPLVNDVATLTWLGQIAALEIHVPQWRFASRGARMNPDRLVLDLDPGEGAGLPECVEVAGIARELLQDVGLDPMPVTSGSKGIHLYAALDGTRTSAQISDFAHELARVIEADHPDLAVSDMKKSRRTGKVLVDWSQNNGNKTTVVPYSLRGRSRPTVAAPRTWRELSSSRLRQLEFAEVLQRLGRRGDPLAELASGHPHLLLEEYRAKRSPEATPEPFGDRAHRSRDAAKGPIFVIQKHQAGRLHYDLRLERDGVLVSWAVPKGPPDDPAVNHLAVQTEDHPLDYAGFEGEIPAGEYGAGQMEIWDAGTYELEKWRTGTEIMLTLHGRRGSHRYALIHTRDDDWLMHLMAPAGGSTATSGRAAEASGPTEPRPADDPARASTREPSIADLTPMLASAVPAGGIPEGDWVFEPKWDGIRAIAEVSGGRVTLRSRNGLDLTPSYPELQALAEAVEGDAVVDGEIVALSTEGRPDFGLLQQRMGVTRPRDVERLRRAVPVHYFAFDLLAQGGRAITGRPYVERRAALSSTVGAAPGIQVPPDIGTDLDDAVAISRELRLEGVMAKRERSVYRSGRRSQDWLKIKHHATQEVVVIGWREGKGRRAGGIGSLLVALPHGDELRYAGRVGTGFSDRELDDLAARFARMERTECPATGIPPIDARDAHWVTPELVGEVELTELTRDGRLRHPSWRGWRPDKSPTEVVVEAPSGVGGSTGS